MPNSIKVKLSVGPGGEPLVNFDAEDEGSQALLRDFREALFVGESGASVGADPHLPVEAPKKRVQLMLPAARNRRWSRPRGVMSTVEVDLGVTANGATLVNFHGTTDDAKRVLRDLHCRLFTGNSRVRLNVCRGAGGDVDDPVRQLQLELPPRQQVHELRARGRHVPFSH